MVPGRGLQQYCTRILEPSTHEVYAKAADSTIPVEADCRRGPIEIEHARQMVCRRRYFTVTLMSHARPSRRQLEQQIYLMYQLFMRAAILDRCQMTTVAKPAVWCKKQAPKFQEQSAHMGTRRQCTLQSMLEAAGRPRWGPARSISLLFRIFCMHLSNAIMGRKGNAAALTQLKQSC